MRCRRLLSASSRTWSSTMRGRTSWQVSGGVQGGVGAAVRGKGGVMEVEGEQWVLENGLRQEPHAHHTPLLLLLLPHPAGDPLGGLAVSQAGVVERDETVWRAALEHGVPILQLLSGGYTKASTPCIASSVENLFAKFALGGGAGPAAAVSGRKQSEL